MRTHSKANTNQSHITVLSGPNTNCPLSWKKYIGSSYKLFLSIYSSEEGPSFYTPLVSSIKLFKASFEQRQHFSNMCYMSFLSKELLKKKKIQMYTVNSLQNVIREVPICPPLSTHLTCKLSCPLASESLTGLHIYSSSCKTKHACK